MDFLVFILTPILLGILVLLFVIANKLTEGACWRITKKVAAVVLFWGSVVAFCACVIYKSGWDAWVWKSLGTVAIGGSLLLWLRSIKRRTP
jgi:hypothetical protein